MDPASSAAPLVPRERSPSLVIICGLASTAATLIGVYLLNIFTEDFNIMGWYANYILPIGALIVGVAASSGYGIASWLTGIKITKSLLCIVLALQVAAYFVAQFIEFQSLHLVHQDTGRPVGFLEYFDLMARSFAWKQNDGKPGEPLGMWGYAFRALEIAGFSAGGLIVPALLCKAPYCDSCQVYMHSKVLAWLPASVQVRKIKKSDAEGLAAYEEEQNGAAQRGHALLKSLCTSGTAGKLEEFQTALDELKAHQKETLKLPRRLWLKLVSCKNCNSGRLESAVVAGQGNQIKETKLDTTPVPSDFAQLIRARKR